MTETDTDLLIAEAEVALAEPAAVLAKLCASLGEHAAVTATDGGAAIDSRFGRAELAVQGRRLRLRALCADDSSLSIVKMVLADALFAAAGEPAPSFVWTGHGAVRRDLPYFREMTVRRAETVTPRMRRVVLTGDVEHFARGGLHVRVLIPPAGRPPRWPQTGADGRIAWPQGADALTPRVYTLRQVDPAAGELAIDVVLHEGDSTPGSDWALGARAGDPVGLLGPGGAGIEPADWYLLAGDETALPAMARILEELPPEARAVVRIEVADAAEEQPLPSRARLDLRWLHRNGAPAGTTGLIEAAVRAVPWPDGATRAFAWVGCEQAAARALRGYLGGERGLDRSARLVVAYWRRGRAATLAADED